MLKLKVDTVTLEMTTTTTIVTTTTVTARTHERGFADENVSKVKPILEEDNLSASSSESYRINESPANPANPQTSSSQPVESTSKSGSSSKVLPGKQTFTSSRFILINRNCQSGLPGSKKFKKPNLAISSF